MIGAKQGGWIYLFILLKLLIFVRVEGFDVPLTLVQSAVAKGAGWIILLLPHAMFLSINQANTIPFY